MTTQHPAAMKVRTKILCAAASLSLATGGQAVAVCPWDCGDGDGHVGIVDFLGLLADWGQPGHKFC